MVAERKARAAGWAAPRFVLIWFLTDYADGKVRVRLSVEHMSADQVAPLYGWRQKKPGLHQKTVLLAELADELAGIGHVLRRA